MAIVFTGDEFADGAEHILAALKAKNVKASFFLTGNFYANRNYKTVISRIKNSGHYLGAHSDKHLLYCDWSKRDSLLVTPAVFRADLDENYRKMAAFGIKGENARYFLPPYEWYNDSIAEWTQQASLQLVNFSPGTRSAADYTTPAMKGYKKSEEIFESITDYERRSPNGLNGFILLLHIGTDHERKDKFYLQLERLLDFLQTNNYRPVTIASLLDKN